MPVFKVVRSKDRVEIVEVIERPEVDPAIEAKVVAAGLDPAHSVIRWLADSCILLATSSETAQDLYEGYSTWMEARGEAPVSKTAFGRRLAALGLKRDKKAPGGLTRWLGVRLRVLSKPGHESDGSAR
mgnify:CR=1 FL=1